MLAIITTTITATAATTVTAATATTVITIIAICCMTIRSQVSCPRSLQQLMSEAGTFIKVQLELIMRDSLFLRVPSP